uniref:Pentatricopeptide repeat protein n=1 Tax=Salvia miltiorrhiza TaxID=226208 RepID=A0A678WEB8_SALMI|nr:pentatricopeptide repeat protein [Salvia miltiorrhiza]
MEFWHQRTMISKALSTALFHSQPRSESPNPSPSSTQWFVKVVFTLCARHPQSLAILNSDYFRNNLDPFVAYGVIYLLNSKLDEPNLACSFFSYSRLNLNVMHTESTFDLLLRSLCRANLVDFAKTVYDYMRADRIVPDKSLLDYLVTSFSHAGKFGVAEDILIARAELCNHRDETVNPFVYNKFLSLLISRNQVDKAVLFFTSRMLKLRGFRPDNFTFNIVMRGMCLTGKVDKAFELFDVMRSFGCYPDLVTYNTLINGLCRVGNADRAQELLREIQCRCEFSPDVVSYTSVISGYCKSGKMEDAATLFHEMIDRGIRPNLFSFNVVIDGFGKKGDIASALKIYERMVSSHVRPDVVTLTSLIEGHSRVGDMDQCMKLLDEMNKRNVSPNAYAFSIIINGLCKGNRLNEACSLLRQLNGRKDIIPQPFIYNPVIDVLCKAGKIDEANAIVLEMEAKGCTHDKMTYTILILGHCMKGRPSEAIKLYKKMLSTGCAPDSITINSLVSCLRKAGMRHEANEIEKNALNNVQTCSLSSERTTEFRINFKIPAAA